MFLEVLTPRRRGGAGLAGGAGVETAVRRWRGRDQVMLFDEAVQVLAASVLLNVVRPTVAVAWFVAFADIAPHEHPQWGGASPTATSSL